MYNSKLLRLLPLAISRPIEFYDRVATKFEFLANRIKDEGSLSGTYCPSPWDHVISRLEECLGPGTGLAFAEPALAEIEREVEKRGKTNLGDAPFSLAHCSDLGLARFCYALVRAIKPEIALETGVAFGVTSAYILKALDVNQQGTLHSIDLPPLGKDADKFVGILIPEYLRSRWQLHRGPTRRVLPKLLPTLAPIGVFVHDSLHTYRTMRYEFRTVTPYLTPCAVVIADDIQDNAAFSEWVSDNKPAFSATICEPEKDGLFGVGVRR
jgi:hypothetical protein